MTMFTRNDKSPEPVTRSSAPAGDKPEAAAPPTQPQEIRRPQEPVHTASSHHLSTVPSQSMSVISKALKITGQLESTENIQIDGEVEGDVRGVCVKVGHSAKVKGAVYGDEVELSGTVEGKIEAKKVVLTGSARMSGDVIHQDITIQSGAYISGHCRPEFGKGEARSVVLNKPKEAMPRP